MKSLNRAQLIGRLGADPEMRFTPQGRAVTTFRVATDRKFKRGDEMIQETEWHQVIAWDKDAERANEYLSKGSLVFVEGRLRTSSWDDKEYDYKHSRTEIVANNITFLDPKVKEEPDKPKPPKRDAADTSEEDSEESDDSVEEEAVAEAKK